MKAAKRYLVVAHRGASAYEPENTLSAFRRAIEMGADMSELDLHLTRDGQLVVIHDPDVARTTDGHGMVQDLTLDQIRQFRAPKGEHIPAFQQVLDAVRGQSGLYIELKAAGTPAALVPLLRSSRFTDRKQVIVGSFEPRLVEQVKALAPELSTSVLLGPVMTAEELIAAARAARADFVHLCWERRDPHPHTLVPPALLDAVHAAGIGVVLWHEERPEELEHLCRMDVDAICSNTPDKL